MKTGLLALDCDGSVTARGLAVVRIMVVMACFLGWAAPAWACTFGINCPSNIVVATCSNDVIVNYSATVTDTCCSNGTAVVFNPPSGSSFTPGTHMVTVTATDGCNDSDTCTFYVIVNEGFDVTCAPDKTVACGSSWTFDTPTAASCCGSNVSIVPAGLSTNGTCPQVEITQYWLIQDSCGNSNVCSQTVTVTGCCNSPCACTNGISGVFSNLYRFTDGLDGASPAFGALTSSGSALYGTAEYGGAHGYGTVFKINMDGTGFQTLYSFGGYGNGDGGNPWGGLVLSGTTLYGTTLAGGSLAQGTIFSIQTSGSGYAILHGFGGAGGEIPYAGLAISGKTLYGTTSQGGSPGGGTIFSIQTSGGSYTVLYDFTGGNDGSTPYGTFVASGNTVYGTTANGNSFGSGTVFSFQNPGGLATLHDFSGYPNDGGNPIGGLVLSGSTLYGTTDDGDSFNAGTVFTIGTSGGGLTYLHQFNGGDGWFPYGSLCLSGSTLFGTTSGGGAYGLGATGGGTLFAVQTDGSGFTVLHSFVSAGYDGSFPWAGVVSVGNTVYGTTYGGGISNYGTIYSYTVTNFATNCLQVQCPNDIVDFVTNCSAPVEEFYAPVVTDNACSNYTVTCTPPSGTYFAPGSMTTVSCLVTDCCGNSFSCNFTVTVNCTNCCADCTAPYPDSYSVTLYPGTNYIAEDILPGSNDTVADLLINPPPGTDVGLWDPIAQNYNWDSFSFGAWTAGGAEPLSPGEGFVVINPSFSNYTLTFYGCQPQCPPPCAPPNGWSLVGGYGTNAVMSWSDLYGCPPPCGTEIMVFNYSNQQFSTYTYGNGTWVPPLPVPLLPVGESAWIDVDTNAAGMSVTCAPDKTVSCSTNWTFDTPTATTCCADGVVNVVALGAVTNGVCPQVEITQTWIILDDCGDSNTCSQTVTVEGCCGSSNCCTNCTAPYPDSYTITIYPGSNYVADTLCQGTNDTVAAVITNVPVGTYLYLWNPLSQSVTVEQYLGAGKGHPSGWLEGGTETLSPGEGFIVLNISGTNFNLTLSGCQPQCPPPCEPPLGLSMVGGFGVNPVMSWSDLFSCTPPCGTEITILNPATQQSATYTYGSGGWAPPLPVPLLGAGESAWIYAPSTTPLQLSCPVNKTVQCGTQWTFDTPAAQTCCTNELATGTGSFTNLLVTPDSPVTNGVCPAVMITETWLIEDGCGDTTNCSQTVTVTGCCTNGATNPCGCTNGTIAVEDYQLLHDFAGGLDGAMPFPGLITSGDTLYGTTISAGSSGFGTIFSLKTDGSGFNIVHAFTAGAGDAYAEDGGLILSGTTLYGTADGSGVPPGGSGTIFSVQTSGANYTDLYSFNWNGADGIFPISDLLLSGSTLYGVTYGQPSTDTGTIYSIQTSGSGFTTLHKFAGSPTEGANPRGTFVSSGSILYGTTEYGGVSGDGTVFAFNTSASTLTVLHSFNNSDGSQPWGGLVLSGTTLYGTTSGGGAGDGTVFAIQTDGSGFTDLHNFSGSDGSDSLAGLILSGTTLLGTTAYGGSANAGTVFALQTDGSGFMVLHSFTGAGSGPVDGAYPMDRLLLSGNTIYGITQDGGTNNDGTVFALTLTNLVSNCLQVQCPPDISVTVTNCAAAPVQEFYAPIVTDLGCSNWVVTCTPPSGSYFSPNTTTTVNCTVTDCCSNTATCSFTVEVTEITNLPIVVNVPANIVICTGTSNCGVMPGETGQPPIFYDLYNTGVDIASPPNPLANGTLNDPHWKLVSVPPLPPASPLEFGTTTQIQVSDLPGYIVGDSLSAWIGPNNDVSLDGPQGEYDYQTTFQMPCAGAIMITGQIGADNSVAKVLLNGISIPPGGATSANFGAWAPFTLTGSAHAGLNTLDVIVYNNPSTGGDPPAQYTDTPTALRVEFFSVTDPCPCLGATATSPCGETIMGTQSIPPGTLICSNTTITLTYSNLLGQVTNIVVPVTLEHCADCLTLDCPPDIVVTSCSNSAVVTYSANATDVCCSNAGGTNCVTVSFLPPSGSVFPVGTNLVICTASDSECNTTNCEFTVVVVESNHLTLTVKGASSAGSADAYWACPGQSVTFNAAVSGGSGGLTYQWSFNQVPIAGASSPTYTLPSATITDSGTYCVSVNGPCGIVEQCVTLDVSPLNVICPANKSVACSSVWAFDTPTAMSCCASNIRGSTNNVLITTNSTVTNGACPQVMITRTWSIIDACGDSNTCSQTVTVEGCCTNCLHVQSPVPLVVQCGQPWNFIAPTATTCCADGVVHIVSLGAVTNGICPQMITNTWEVYDDCGNSALAGQEVEIIDTTPPEIACQTTPVYKALNSNCQLVIPSISVTASDNCTPYCSLVYSQSPAANTVTNATSIWVTVTVTDLCGNSNSCRVFVQGTYQKGMVITWPASVTSSNCTVPCVNPYIVVSDCSCPVNDISIKQSPECGTPVGPGLTKIYVTIRDCNGEVVSQSIPLTVSGESSFISALTNTGVAVNGSLQPHDTDDPHYGLIAVPSAPPGYLFPKSVVITNLWTSVFSSINSAKSRWIAPTTYLPINTDLDRCPAGYYNYTNQFTLASSVDLSTASISGQWAADDYGAGIYLNGSPTGNTTLYGFSKWTPFTITNGFQHGLNTLTFLVQNFQSATPQYNPTGLRVEYISASLCNTCTPPVIIPINSSQSLQVGSVATLSASTQGTPPMTYQWNFNGTDIPGATNATLHLDPVTYMSAGTYSLIAYNPCATIVTNGGGIGPGTGGIHLAAVPPLPWANGAWNISDPTNPLGATYGPDLALGTTNPIAELALGTGTTEDMGLPNPGGQIVNALDINPAVGAVIQMPPIVPAGSNSVDTYTVIMDLYEPDTGLGTPATLFSTSDYVTNLGSGGQDGLTLSLDVSNYLHLTGSSGGLPFDFPSAVAMPVDSWNRVAFVFNNPNDGGNVTYSTYLNGIPANFAIPCLCCPPFPIDNNSSSKYIGITTNSFITVVSPPAGGFALNPELFVAGIQFHAIAMTPQMLATLGSPDTSAASVSEIVAGPPPNLTATLTSSGTVNITWTGAPYTLQETTDLGSGVWTPSDLPFTEAETNGTISTTAVVQPTTQAPAEFYRLSFSP